MYVSCDPMSANEALSGKINFELWAKMSSKVKISQKLKYAWKQSLTMKLLVWHKFHEFINSN